MQAMALPLRFSTAPDARRWNDYIWPKAVIDDVEKSANSMAAFCREAELQLLILCIAAYGQQGTFRWIKVKD